MCQYHVLCNHATVSVTTMTCIINSKHQCHILCGSECVKIKIRIFMYSYIFFILTVLCIVSVSLSYLCTCLWLFCFLHGPLVHLLCLGLSIKILPCLVAFTVSHYHVINNQRQHYDLCDKRSMLLPLHMWLTVGVNTMAHVIDSYSCNARGCLAINYFLPSLGYGGTDFKTSYDVGNKRKYHAYNM